MPPSLRGDQTSAVTCQSSPDRWWPCSALLETIWIDLAFSSCFCCWFPRQLACKRGAMPNKTGLIGSQISWFIGFESDGLNQKCSAFSYSVVEYKIFYADSLCTLRIFLTVNELFTLRSRYIKRCTFILKVNIIPAKILTIHHQDHATNVHITYSQKQVENTKHPLRIL